MNDSHNAASAPAPAVVSRPRTMRERAAARAAMGDPSFTKLADTREPVQGPRQRAYAAAWRPATTLPSDQVIDLFGVTVGPSRGQLLPLHCERVESVQASTEAVRVILVRDRGHGPDQGMRVVTLTRARDSYGVPIPEHWCVSGDVPMPMPDTVTSRGASKRALTWPERLDPGMARVRGVV